MKYSSIITKLLSTAPLFLRKIRYDSNTTDFFDALFQPEHPLDKKIDIIYNTRKTFAHYYLEQKRPTILENPLLQKPTQSQNVYNTSYHIYLLQTSSNFSSKNEATH